MRTDVVILGGGPAGVAAALSLRRLRPQSRVVLVESGGHEPCRCGETLPPGCRPILESLGCWDQFRAENFPEAYSTSAVWSCAAPYENEFLYSARGSGWYLDRGRFDSMLRTCAEQRGVAVLRNARFADSQQSDSGWKLAIRHCEARVEIASAFVIDATGRNSSFARRQGARTIPDDRLIGVVGVLRCGSGVLPTLVESQLDGWWYSTRIPGPRLVVAWMSDSDLVRTQSMCDGNRWTERLRQSRLTAERISEARLEMPLRVFAAHSQRLEPAAGSGWAAAGDAASTCDPLASQGILRALRTGKMASFAAVDFIEGRSPSLAKYNRMIASEYAAYCETKTWYYSLEQRWPNAVFWSRRMNRRSGQAA